MQTTLISVIGRPSKGRYDHAIYELNNQSYETDFFFIPLLKHYQPDKFYLLGTRDSIWEQVEKAREKVPFDYEKIIIPFGINSQEIWQIFETIVRLPLRDTKLVIDITHGFRAIPFAVFLAALYFQSVREDVEIEDILYGNYEARNPETKVAPVVHLKSYLDMYQWIRAARRFVQYGDGDLLIQKLTEQLEKFPAIGSFIQHFQRFVDNLQLTFVTQVAPQARRTLSQMTKETKRQLKSLPAFGLLYPQVIYRLRMLENETHEWQRQWRLAEWFASNRQYTQAIIVLREMLITFTAELLGKSITAYTIREKQVGYFHTYFVFWKDSNKLRELKLTPAQISKVQNGISHLIETIGETLLNRWRKLLDEIHQARNLTGHALMRGKSEKEIIDPEEQIRRIHMWVREVREVLDQLQHHQPVLKEQLLALWPMLFEKAPRVFIIINQGVHPIVEDLKRQFGENLQYEVVTEGNVDVAAEAQIVQRVKDIVQRHRGAEFVLVPSGFPYLITLVYNTLWQITSTHPIYLQYDREQQQYVEKDLNPRNWLGG